MPLVGPGTGSRTLFRAGALLMAGAAVSLAGWLLAAPQPGSQTGASHTLSQAGDPGRMIYLARCSPCHGESGRGDGPAALPLNPRPRDFTTGVYAYRSTESGSLPTDEDLLRTIREGLPGTAMPAWEKFITGDSLTALLSYIKSFSPRFLSEAVRPVKVGQPVPPTPASIESGRAVFEKLQCASCHGSDGAGSGAAVTEFQDAGGFPIRAANLTEPWTFHGGHAPRDIFLRFRTGVDGSPMPSYAGAASEGEMWDLANYVVSLGRKPLWEMEAGAAAGFVAGRREKARTDPVSWGEYLVRTRGSVAGHTPADAHGGYMEQYGLAGGRRWDLGAFGEVVSPNLTSDSATGLGRWTDDQIRGALTRGIRRDGSRMLPFPMPWTAYANMTGEDLSAIIAYLRTIPPLRNAVPPPKPLGFFRYLAAKFRLLIQKEQFVSMSYPGNAGEMEPAQEKAPEHGVVPKEEHP